MSEIKSGNTLASILAECICLVDRTLELSDPVVADLKSGNKHDDMVPRVISFLESVEAIKPVCDSIPIKNGVMPPGLAGSDREESERLFPQLIEKLQRLERNEAVIIDKLSEEQAGTSNKLESVRNAKKIFTEFVKSPKQAPRFFDRDA